ncbi:hypothetical protein FB451DRAFT_634191 [Mycena latifolia]|nr:hypothetical protein FB451DRAFT_634191 [Mycena latifolia]
MSTLLSPPPHSILLPSQPSTNSLSSSASASTSASSSSASSSTSSHTSASHTNTPTMHKPPRRIRFAPLPDPRRLDDDADTDVKPPELTPATPEPAPVPSPAASPYASPAAAAPLALPPTTSPPSSFHPPTKSSTWPKPKSFLRPFRRGTAFSSPMSSTDSLTPTPSMQAQEEPKWGAALTRWGSSSSATAGSPLARTQSQTSVASTSTSKRRALLPSLGLGSGGKSKGKDSPAAAAAKKQTASVPPALNPFASAALGGKRGTRMLNGRVYGSRNANGTHNPFGNARDDEPEFVEWGYGGMGSVRNGHAAWGRVQAGSGGGASAVLLYILFAQH